MANQIPTKRPSLKGGARSLRAYRRVADYFLEMMLAGAISCREGKAGVEASHVAGQMYMAERQLTMHLADEEAPDHPLGRDGGAEMVDNGVTPLLNACTEDEVGYETLVPAPEDNTTRMAMVDSVGRTGDKLPTKGLNQYPSKGADKDKYPPPPPKDANKIVI